MGKTARKSADIRPFGDVPKVVTTDVAVVGGGNAAMCAALAAADSGARVLVLERAPRPFRGGNSRHTRDVRVAHGDGSPYAPGRYDETEFMDDLLRVTGGRTDRDLAQLVVRQSGALPGWMESHGVRWQKALRGTLHLASTNVFMRGGGTAMMNGYYLEAERRGVQTLYNAAAVGLNLAADGHFDHADVLVDGEPAKVEAAAVVVAAGGFEANLTWLSRYWGDAAGNFIVRGSPYNTGQMLETMLSAGAQPVGDPREFHAIAVDGRAPKFDGGIVTRLDSVPFGIVVNKNGERFYDEGEDFWPKRYAIWGGLIAAQPEQIAFSIVDSKVISRFMPSLFPPVQAMSLDELASALNLDPASVAHTVRRYNAATTVGSFDPSSLDNCATVNLAVPKSHWALPIDTPPYYGYPLRPGITFTYLGVRVNEQARIVMNSGRPAPNVYAAGEIMAGNVLGRGYLAGVGLTIGAVFGRIAGEEAARIAR